MRFLVLDFGVDPRTRHLFLLEFARTGDARPTCLDVSRAREGGHVPAKEVITRPSDKSWQPDTLTTRSKLYPLSSAHDRSYAKPTGNVTGQRCASLSEPCLARCKLLQPEIQYKKPHFQYNLYQECAFLCLISGCMQRKQEVIRVTDIVAVWKAALPYKPKTAGSRLNPNTSGHSRHGSTDNKRQQSILHPLLPTLATSTSRRS
eukprot:2795895-Rhodomonas_salina.1